MCNTISVLYLCLSLSFGLPRTLQHFLAYTWSLANNIPDQLLSATKIISACWWNAATSLLAVISNLIMLIDPKYWHFPHINILTIPSRKDFEVPLWGSTSKPGREYMKRVEYRGTSFTHPKHSNHSARISCSFVLTQRMFQCYSLFTKHYFTVGLKVFAHINEQKRNIFILVNITITMYY